MAGPMPNFDHMPVTTGNEVDRLLILADMTLLDKRRSAAVIGLAIMRIIRLNPQFGLRYLEVRYRALDSATYLIAIPKHLAPSYISVLSVDGKEMPYFLWTGMNGRREADAKLVGLKTTYAENLERLSETGFLMVQH